MEVIQSSYTWKDFRYLFLKSKIKKNIIKVLLNCTQVCRFQGKGINGFLKKNMRSFWCFLVANPEFKKELCLLFQWKISICKWVVILSLKFSIETPVQFQKRGKGVIWVISFFYLFEKGKGVLGYSVFICLIKGTKTMSRMCFEVSLVLFFLSVVDFFLWMLLAKGASHSAFSIWIPYASMEYSIWLLVRLACRLEISIV